jgi:hypothetical protein
MKNPVYPSLLFAERVAGMRFLRLPRIRSRILPLPACIKDLPCRGAAAKHLSALLKI